MIKIWAGGSKSFGTRALYGSVAGALTALVAMTVVVAWGFDAAVIAILAIGIGVTGLVVLLAPPAHCAMRSANQIAVGDLLATSDDDFVVRAAPVVVATVALRGGNRVHQFGTASGGAYEVSESGRLPVVEFGRGRGPSTGVDNSAALPEPSGPDDAPWPWAEVVATLVGRLLDNSRAGGAPPTRDQIVSDLVARTRCTVPTAQHGLEAAVGLGLVRRGRVVTVTPAGAVWFASRTYGVGSRIEAPRWVDPGRVVALAAGGMSEGNGAGFLADEQILDLSSARRERDSSAESAPVS
ncbi:MAG: hypothetical protein Q8P61_06200 [Candidatus Nanopelagicales bacterium]|nr:hypothetical protein [Candidatus Nanopelagicales bacterium]